LNQLMFQLYSKRTADQKAYHSRRLPAVAQEDSTNGTASNFQMRINGKRFAPKGAALGRGPALSDYSSYSKFAERSLVRCSSTELQFVLNDVECEYTDSLSTDELFPFGIELPSTRFCNDIHDAMDNEEATDIAPSPSAAATDSAAPLSFVPEANKMDDIRSVFQRRGVLGSGASCRVLKAFHPEKGTDVALKEISRAEASNLKRFRQEVEVLGTLQHPNIVRMEDCFVDDENYYVATEYCSGGTMLEKMNRMRTLSEIKAAGYIRTLLQVVQYMHSLDVVHQDLKLSNLVFTRPGVLGELKVIDVGDSIVVDDDKTYHHFVGTRSYLPPEVRRARTGRELKKGDLWTVGVICFLMLFGRRPFLMSGAPSRRSEDMMNSMASRTRHSLLSDDCRDFMAKLLCSDPAARWTAEEALESDWITSMSAAIRKRQKEGLSPLPSSPEERQYLDCIRHRRQSAQALDWGALDALDVDSILDSLHGVASAPNTETAETSAEIEFYGDSEHCDSERMDTALSLTVSLMKGTPSSDGELELVD